MKKIIASSVMAVGVFLFFAVGAFGQRQIAAPERSRDAASAASTPVVSTPIEPDSPAADSGAAAGPQANSQAIVPRLIKFSGVLRDILGHPMTGPLDVTFALYDKEAGGDPLWYETQTVQADQLGRYTALVGAMHTDGLPVELFTSGEAHWLGIQVGHEQELQPRVLLVSVPYALKAGDAETLGGKPASAYMLSDSQSTGTSGSGPTSIVGTVQAGGSGKKLAKTSAGPLTTVTPCSSVTSDGGAVANQIALYTSACALGEDAGLVDVGGDVGIGTATPNSKITIAADGNAGIYNGSTQFAIQGVGNPNQVLLIGYDTTNNKGYIQPANQGVAYEPLLLNPNGGDVGIGTATPNSKITIAADGNAGAYNGSTQFAIQGVGNPNQMLVIGYDTTNNKGYIQPANQGVAYEPLLLNPNGGNVGIGTTTPAATLEVNGTAQFDQGVTFAQPITTSGVLTSTVTTGTAPLSVASNTQVTNLNASLLDGLAASAFQPAGSYAVTTGPNSFSGTQTISTGDLAVSNGNVDLPLTTGSTVGGITLGGSSFIHGCCSGGSTQNTFIGYQSGNFTMSGAGNLGMGGQTLNHNTSGGFNTAIGLAALLNNTLGNFNVGGGDDALQANNTGNNNVAVGTNAMQSNTSGSNNTALGFQAGSTANTANANVTGNLNTFIGYNAGPGTATQLTNATAVGANSVVSANNALVLGGTGTNAVNVGIGTATPGKALDVTGDIRASGCFLAGATVVAGTCSSDARLKTNIKPFSPVLSRLVQLQPVHFYWRVAEYPEFHFGSGRSSGVIAQEVEKVFPDLVTVDRRGFKQVNYSEFPYLMLEAIRELKFENDSLRERMKLQSTAKDEQIHKLTQQVEELQQVRNELTALEARLTRLEVGAQAVAARKAQGGEVARMIGASQGSLSNLATHGESE